MIAADRCVRRRQIESDLDMIVRLADNQTESAAVCLYGAKRLETVAKSKKASQSGGGDGGDRVICRNRRARHEYDVLETLDCGIVLQGSEVKSLRDSRVSLDEAYARVERSEVWLYNADIAEYPQANVMNHEPRRKRKLLLKRREIRKFAEDATHDGRTLVPLELFFRRGIAKVKLAVVKGRRQHDKRERLKQAAAGKEIREALRGRR